MSWENNVRKVVPYVAGEQPKSKNVIKLNTNECPYPPAPGVEAALNHFDYDVLRKYPDPDVADLRAVLAARYKVPAEQVFVGVGSDDVLAMAFLTFFNSDKPILFPDITYSFYDVWADLYRIPYECQVLDEKFEIKKEEYINKTFRMPVELIKKMEVIAQNEGVSLNKLVIQCCEYSISHLKK